MKTKNEACLSDMTQCPRWGGLWELAPDLEVGNKTAKSRGTKIELFCWDLAPDLEVGNKTAKSQGTKIEFFLLHQNQHWFAQTFQFSEGSAGRRLQEGVTGELRVASDVSHMCVTCLIYVSYVCVTCLIYVCHSRELRVAASASGIWELSPRTRSYFRGSQARPGKSEAKRPILWYQHWAGRSESCAARPVLIPRDWLRRLWLSWASLAATEVAASSWGLANRAVYNVHRWNLVRGYDLTVYPTECNETCDTHVWDMWHTCMRHVTHMYETCYIWIYAIESPTTKTHRTLKSVWINKSLVNPKSTSNQSSKPCTVLQYPSRKAHDKRTEIRISHAVAVQSLEGKKCVTHINENVSPIWMNRVTNINQ